MLDQLDRQWRSLSEKTYRFFGLASGLKIDLSLSTLSSYLFDLFTRVAPYAVTHASRLPSVAFMLSS